MRIPEPELALVLGDFGRDAALRFCARLAEAERSRIRELLPSDASFYDEHRRILLSLVGDLHFVKEPTLGRYRLEGRSFDDGVLVGFPGGVELQSVVVRLGVLALEAMAGPLRRGIRRAHVYLPCNTLAPVSWALEQRFATADALQEMVREAGLEIWDGLEALIERLTTGEVRLRFPTVPGAVIEEAKRQGAERVVPLGTMDIAAVYTEAARREGGRIRCLDLCEADRQTVRDAIRAALSGKGEQRSAARGELLALKDRLQSSGGERQLIVEACTDLDYGVGLDSVDAYVTEAIREVYGDETGG